MKILLDNGHGVTTPGKRSPDGRLREYKYCRELAKGIHDTLKAQGYDVELVTPEDADVSIANRVVRVNKICKRVGAKNCILISLHLDAKGCGEAWYSARGFSARVAYNSSVGSRRLAKALTELAKDMKLMGNRAVPEDGYWMQDLGICRMTNCPAVLTESAFMTNKDEVEWLLSDEGRKAIVELHVNAIKKYING